MRRFIVLAAAALALAVPASAQISSLVWPGPGAAGGGGAAYVGPGDITSFTVWYGLRAYTAAIAAAGTQPLIKVQRASDSHNCDILVATSGGLGNTASCSTPADNGTAPATFCNATTCNITVAYDQTNGNACGAATCNLNTNVNAGAITSFPTLSFNCINTSLPCMLANSTPGQSLTSANNFTPNALRQVSLSVLGWNSGGGTAFFLAQNGANNFLEWSAANTWTWFGGNAGSVAATLTDSAFHAGNLSIDLTTNTSTFNGDGTETTSTSVNNFAGAGIVEMARQTSAGTAQQVEGGFADATVWALSIRSKLCWQQHLYWGTTAGTHCNAAGT